MFIAYDPLLGEVKLTDVDTVGPGPFSLTGSAGAGAGRMSFSMEILRGYDTLLGGGEFAYAQAGATLTVGAVVQFNQSQGALGQIINQAVLWAGTANSGDVLGVAMAPLTVGQWGWFQIEGNAIVNCSGAPTSGSAAFYQAAGVVSPTAVAGKQVIGAKFATAPGVTLGTGASAVVLSGTQAVILLQRPNVQTQIT